MIFQKRRIYRASFPVHDTTKQRTMKEQFTEVENIRLDAEQIVRDLNRPQQ